MRAADCVEQPRRRRSAALPLTVSLHLVGMTSARPFAAVLLAQDDEAVCWYNRRLIKGAKLGLVELWARRALASGWHAQVLRERDLAGLT